MNKLTREQALSLAQSISDSTYNDLLTNIEGDYIDELSDKMCKISARASSIAVIKLLDYLQMIDEPSVSE